MKTILILALTSAIPLVAQPRYQGQLSSIGNGFGTSVATDGVTLAAAGRSFVDFYTWNGTDWKLSTRVGTNGAGLDLAIYKGSALGKHANGIFAFEFLAGKGQLTQSITLADGIGIYSGSLIAMHDNTAAVGAPIITNGRDLASILSRAAQSSRRGLVQAVYAQSANTDNFGLGVSLRSSNSIPYLLVGAPLAFRGKRVVYAYRQNGSTFSIAGSIPSSASGVARFGNSFGRETSHVLIGAPANFDFKGCAHLYELSLSSTSFSSAARAFLTSNAPMLFGENLVLTSSYAVISSPSTFAHYTFAYGAIGNATQLAVPAYSNIWGTALASATSLIFASDANALSGAGAVALYR